MRRLVALLGCALALAVVSASAGTHEGEAVSAARVTMSLRPTVLRPNGLLTVFGAIDSGREGESVTIQTKDCGLSSFTGVVSATTRAGGSYTAEFRPNVGAQVRATWNGATSAAIAVQAQPVVQLFKRARNRFEVGISAKGQFWRKRVLFQIRRGGWKTMKSVVLTETEGQPGFPFVYTSAEFSASVPRGTDARAVLTAAQAKPCYLGNVSAVIRA